MLWDFYYVPSFFKNEMSTIRNMLLKSVILLLEIKVLIQFCICLISNSANHKIIADSSSSTNFMFN